MKVKNLLRAKNKDEFLAGLEDNHAKKGSLWFELNKERCRRMEKLGKMTVAIS